MLTTAYVAITPFKSLDINLDELRISVDYFKGRGFYAVFKPVHRDGYSEQCSFLTGDKADGHKIMLKEAKRDNAKLREKMLAAIADSAKDIAKAFDADDYEDIDNIAGLAICSVLSPGSTDIYSGICDGTAYFDNNGKFVVDPAHPVNTPHRSVITIK